jgi:hypothetical protein
MGRAVVEAKLLVPIDRNVSLCPLRACFIKLTAPLQVFKD